MWPHPIYQSVTAIPPELWPDVVETSTFFGDPLLVKIVCLFLFSAVKGKSCFICCQRGPLAVTFCFGFVKLPSAFQCLSPVHQLQSAKPSDSVVLIISTSTEPSKSLRSCTSLCSFFFWCFIHFSWGKFNNDHLHQTSFYLLVWCFSFVLGKIQTELKPLSSVSGMHNYLIY